MCLAYPGKITKIKNKKYALVNFDGLVKEINLELIEKPKIGDYVNVHAGFAIQKLSQKDAREILKFYAR